MNKLRPVSHSICETLLPSVTDSIISGLFPTSLDPPLVMPDFYWSEEYAVSRAEVKEAIEKLNTDKKAPGPDGILGGVLSIFVTELIDPWCGIFTLCLRDGSFPINWKIAKVTLLKKKDIDSVQPSNFRPICLLDESGKMFERILVNRLIEHMNNSFNLSNRQYGFRKGRSTNDAILRVKKYFIYFQQDD
jgi:hypothetical protein